MRIFIILMLSLVLISGCTVLKREPRVEVKYQKVYVPVSNVPVPPNTECPLDALENITIDKAANDGELAKAYRIAVLQLRDCSKLRQKVIDKYRDMSKHDAAKIEDLQPSSSAPFGAAGPVVNPASQGVVYPDNEVGDALREFDKALAEFNSLVGDASKSLRSKVLDKYNEGEVPNTTNTTDDGFGSSPFGAAAPVVNPASVKPNTGFNDLESEFSDLSAKEYEIE